MNKDAILQMKSQLDSFVQTIQEEHIEFWFARDLQEPLGYARWENFITVIHRAIESCKSTGFNPNDHFRSVTKMIPLGKGETESSLMKKSWLHILANCLSYE